MSTLIIPVDAHTEKTLLLLSRQEGNDVAGVAARLLARAVRDARPRPSFDTEAIKAANTPFEEDDENLAGSGGAERLELLAQEDRT